MAPGKVQPGRFCELGYVVGSLGDVVAALGTATGSVPLQQPKIALVIRVEKSWMQYPVGALGGVTAA